MPSACRPAAEVNVHLVTSSRRRHAKSRHRPEQGRHPRQATTVLERWLPPNLLTQDERDLGCCLLDIAWHHRAACFRRRRGASTSAVAIGGDHFTNDLAVGLRTAHIPKRKIKRR